MPHGTPRRRCAAVPTLLAVRQLRVLNELRLYPAVGEGANTESNNILKSSVLQVSVRFRVVYFAVMVAPMG